MNSPEDIQRAYLSALSSDFNKVSDLLRESSQRIRAAGFEYPLFIASRAAISLGKMLIERELFGLRTHYYASFLGELLQRNIVSAERRAAFVAAYKDPEWFCCLLALEEDFTQWVYIPYRRG